MISRNALVAALAGTGLLVGCSSTDSVPSPAPAPRPSVTVSPTAPSGSPGASPQPSAGPSTTATPAFFANTREDTEEPSGGLLGLRVARAALQDGYDRVVFELAGKERGTAGWRVEYVSEPLSDGSGDRVAVKGSAYLRVILTGTGYPFDTGVPEPSTRRFSPDDTEVVREVVLNGVYEGQYTAFVGLASQRGFRVFRISDPERVVVDVLHP